MPTQPSRVLLLLSLLSATAWADGATPGAMALVDLAFSRFTEPGLPGCAVGVSQGGKTLLERAYGQANLEHDLPNTPATVFEAGSVSKQFTAAAVLLLAQDGKLSLDDPARRYVPELPDYGTPITLRHLMQHTSGLRDWGTVVDAAGWPRGTRIHTHAHVLDVVSRQKALNFPPGTEYLYCNTGYNLLAIIVARVSGQSFADFTRQRLFVPLGMKHTQWRDDFTRVVKGRATAYELKEERFHSDMPFEDVHGNGGLLTTVGDLLRWNEALAAGKVGGPGFVRELQRQGKLTSGRQLEYASGIVMTSYRGLPEVSHAGATAGYRAFLARYPRQQLSVALLCNHGEVNSVKLAHAVADIFLAGQVPPVPTPGTATLAAQVLSARAGLYRNTRTGEPLELRVREGRLELEDGTPLTPSSEVLFRVGEGAAQLAFDLGKGGRPTAMQLRTPDGDSVPFVPVVPARVDAAGLAGYAGTYVSQEAEVSYAVAAEGDTLVLRRRPADVFTLVPKYADVFLAPELGLVRFTRDASGRVDGLSLFMGRVRDLRFAREASAPVPTAVDRK
ncbi:serine hydrolase domain-containing protein [Pyxidicoccus xibeiensis]|uniref:serine hydrolase domain-containing protein n=1 Tax=Pyxidicoccus xibeiensis TaxID=2906759 RepID=UPI0020A78CAF|nr:serine hydrolase domain-containing protein [Pyxidicoccus xibeiensis]MCP3136314.1 serine hydrolase [Pyxidicoccus xibeiensis]